MLRRPLRTRQVALLSWRPSSYTRPAPRACPLMQLKVCAMCHTCSFMLGRQSAYLSRLYSWVLQGPCHFLVRQRQCAKSGSLVVHANRCCIIPTSVLTTCTVPCFWWQSQASSMLQHGGHCNQRGLA